MMMLLGQEGTDSGNLQVGYHDCLSGVAPPRGHNLGTWRRSVPSHAHGRGVMVVGRREREVATGDVVYVPFSPFHHPATVTSPSRYFWVFTARAKGPEAASAHGLVALASHTVEGMAFGHRYRNPKQPVLTSDRRGET